MGKIHDQRFLNMKQYCLIIIFSLFSVFSYAANLYVITPGNGEVVTSPVTVKFGLQGMGVAPAGIDVKNTGHHHLLIDVKELPDLKEPLPATENIRHFGGGQTEVTLELPKGEHTLQLIMGNHLHIPHTPAVVSEPIKIIVQ